MRISCLIAVITTKPEMRTKVLEMVNENVPAVLEEDGCIVTGQSADTDTVVASVRQFPFN